jgi:hypothetical protein
VNAGFRWYASLNLQFDLVWRGVRLHAEGKEHARRCEHTIEFGVRTIFDLFR